MSNSKRQSYFYPPLKIQSDQKDIIIGHLQEEVYLLRRNQQELIKLQDQYHALEHRLRLLSEDKAHADVDFRERHQFALRNIGQLKNQIDALRADLRQKNLEINDLESDENTLNGQLDQRAIQIDKLKNELNSLLADSQELLNQKLRLDQAAAGIRKDNQLLSQNANNLELDNDATHRKIDDLEKYSSKLKIEEGILKQKIMSYESQNNGLDNDINNLIQDVANLEGQVSNAQSDLNGIQKDIAEIGGLSQKFKSQALHYHKATQAEGMRNNDLAKLLNQAQNTLRLRGNQVDEGNKQIAGLSGQNGKLGNMNSNLREDIEYCRRHLQNLSLLNSDLVINLQKYSQEDDIVRNLIDRKARVVRARTRVEQASTLLVKTTSYVQSGSGRKSKVNY